MIDFQSFIEWVKEKPKSRSIDIEIEAEDRFKAHPTVRVKIDAFDYSIGLGQYDVKSVADINIEALKEEAEAKQYARLKDKFEGV